MDSLFMPHSVQTVHSLYRQCKVLAFCAEEFISKTLATNVYEE